MSVLYSMLMVATTFSLAIRPVIVATVGFQSRTSFPACAHPRGANTGETAPPMPASMLFSMGRVAEPSSVEAVASAWSSSR